MSRIHYAIFGCLISVMLLLGSVKSVEPPPAPVERVSATGR